MRRVAVVIKIIFLLSAVLGVSTSHAVSEEKKGFVGDSGFDVVANTNQFYSADDDKPYVLELQRPPQISVEKPRHYLVRTVHLSRFVDKPCARAPPANFLI